jgi:hypothetical protein
MYLVDIDFLSNGVGKKAYGGKLDAYSFFETTCEGWFEDFSNSVISSIGNNYYPVYRIADGELRFLFGPKINWKNKPLSSILSYLKYGVFKYPWKTSWGEKYNTQDLSDLRSLLKKNISEIAETGKLALYWNENGLNAFTEYNHSMISLFKSIGISLTSENYIPFHFGQALIAKKYDFLFKHLNVLFICSILEEEYLNLRNNIKQMGAKSVSLFKCSSTSSLKEDFTNLSLDVAPDIILVAAGIGAAKVLVDLRNLNCPVIDIGSYIHVLSGKHKNAHAGFFVSPESF